MNGNKMGTKLNQEQTTNIYKRKMETYLVCWEEELCDGAEEEDASSDGVCLTTRGCAADGLTAGSAGATFL